jgi:hypothetical protein
LIYFACNDFKIKKQNITKIYWYHNAFITILIKESINSGLLPSHTSRVARGPAPQAGCIIPCHVSWRSAIPAWTSQLSLGLSWVRPSHPCTSWVLTRWFTPWLKAVHLTIILAKQPIKRLRSFTSGQIPLRRTSTTANIWSVCHEPGGA